MSYFQNVIRCLEEEKLAEAFGFNLLGIKAKPSTEAMGDWLPSWRAPYKGPQLLVPLPDLLRVSGGPSPLQTDCDEMRLDTLVVHDPACL
ncbi:unnamed protein product [Arctogadus glacialis]